MKRAKWDPARHPRGPIGRFIEVGGDSTRPWKPNSRLEGVQRDVLIGDYSDDVARIDQAYSRGTFQGLAMNRLDPQQRAAVNDYTYSSYVNDGLRSGDLPQHRVDQVRQLDSVIEGVTLKRDTLVYRGMRDGILDGAKPGDQLVDRGYMSTTMNPSVAADYGDDFIELQLPAGTHAAPVSKVNPYEMGGVNEVLVGRGAVIEIDSIEEVEMDRLLTENDRHRLIRARLIGYMED